MADQGSDAKHVLDDLSATFQEAVQTYGVTVALSAVVGFAATVVHEIEHYVAGPVSKRDDILGKWTTQFHRYLNNLNETCDAGNRDRKPGGVA